MSKILCKNQFTFIEKKYLVFSCVIWINQTYKLADFASKKKTNKQNYKQLVYIS